MAETRFCLTVRVEPADIDRLQHVNNVAFLRYVQDAAVAHWQSLAPSEAQSALLWVVRRHEIEYFRPAYLGDELQVMTWVGEPSAARWDRFTEILRPADGQLLVQARTVWVLLDRASGRPRRIDPQLARLLAHGPVAS